MNIIFFDTQKCFHKNFTFQVPYHGVINVLDPGLSLLLSGSSDIMPTTGR